MSETPQDNLPLVDNGVNDRNGSKEQLAGQQPRFKKLLLLPLVFLLLGSGGIIGLYFQPPGLKLLFGLTGLEPGGGTQNPIAIPAPKSSSNSADKASSGPNQVLALGRLMPFDDVITIAPPYGAGDARIESIDVEEGEFVERGQLIATLDNRQQLNAAVENARTAVAVRTAQLSQTQATIKASFLEAQANYNRAVAADKLAGQDLARGQQLRSAKQLSQADFERLQAAADEASSDMASAKANLSRYAGIEDNQQTDILLAERNLDNAFADLKRAQTNLSMSEVLAVAAGQVLSINTRRGERPGNDGIATLGNTGKMEVELEVYQEDVQKVALGQKTLISASALGDPPLTGKVSRIGLEVKRQQLIENDPAANTDARVVLVRIELDPASSKRAAAFTGLQVAGRIELATAQ
jgi:HlyD family secretion protein